MKLLKQIIEWFKRTLFFTHFRVKILDDIPDKIKEHSIYVIGKGDPWLLIFLCPCGCGEELRLNMMEEEQPCWTLKNEGKRFDLFPSVNRVKGCRSHFWIKQGKVVWCLKNGDNE